MENRQRMLPMWLKPMIKTFAPILCIALMLVSSTSLHAQQDKPQPPSKGSESGEKKPGDKPAEKKPEPAKEEAKKEIIAITGGNIITVTQGRVRGGTILVEDGKITAVGNDIEVPEGAKTIDASGKTVTPGFIAMDMSRVGLRTSSTSGAKYEDGLDPFDNNVKLCLGVGITTGCVQIRSGGGRGRFGAEDGQVLDTFPVTERFLGLDPDENEIKKFKQESERDFGDFISTCPCCGLPILPTEPITPSRPSPIRPQKNAVIKMSYGSLKNMLVTQNAFLDVTPGSLSGATNQRNWREQFKQARKYLEDQAAHEKSTAAGKKGKPPRKPVSDEVLKLVKKEIALRISAFSVSEMQSLIELAKELDFKFVITGAYESWVIPKQLAEAQASVVLTPRQRRDPRFGAEHRTGTWIETPRVMEESGVPFAVTALSSSISLNGLAGRDLTSLPLEAAFAVRGGASERKALEAITIAPARMMGLDKRIGSIEVGKDADLLILNGQPLDYRTYVETAMVNGRVAYERGKARVLPVYDR
ncbi:MAG: amidohydrolase family protein [Planctomycetota bacterium]